MSAHTKRSPSQAKRSKLCHGALALVGALDSFQKNRSSPAAQLGTAVHGLVEECLKTGRDPKEFEGRIIELVGDEENAKILKPNAKMPGPGRVFFEVDEEIIDGATVMCEYVWGRVEELGVDTSKALQTESRTNPLPERDDTSGTADVTIDAFPELLEVADYKNGWNIVDHNDNEQLRAYLLGKALEALDKKRKYKKYRITVVQPNAPHEQGPIRFVEYTLKELLDFKAEYAETIAKCEEAEQAPGAPGEEGTVADSSDVNPKWAKKYLNAGPAAEQCMFCDAAPVCPARLKLAQTQAAMDFAEEPEELPAPKTLDDVARILAWFPMMEKLASQAMAFGQQALESGQRVPGHKLVRRTATRVFKKMPEETLVAKILKSGMIKYKHQLFTKPKLISGPQAEKLVDRKLRGKFESMFLEKPDAGFAIAPESDRRAAVERNVSDDFESEEFETGADDEMDFG